MCTSVAAFPAQGADHAIIGLWAQGCLVFPREFFVALREPGIVWR